MIQQDLKETLIRFDAAIKESNSSEISRCLKALDEVARGQRDQLDPQLLHFLERRSYQKALAYLQGEGDIPKGRCQGRTDFK